ncbi:4Fe-4S dicluster domain-containing protein [Pedobacter sp. MC2016-24]|uniref:4Fe-4S dicluster domain-containing protein n=1 Tax=Pedobacter sp. MC2016-24 TaxID=2780090 RepID=UPI001880CEE6|nr:4Fe-4S dicluster domain-containing protein [Pedobacter sp. MC2016-24]MBE9602874.1 4Fe-4S dicluster domain-containing protein [Pedobacter sp. MC2016-24]
MVSQILFIALLLAAIAFFSFNVKKVIRNIRLGKAANRSDQPQKRLMTMVKVALGQTKMFFRPVPAFLHLIVYAGFVIINIEVLEIMIDGIFGTHRVFGGLGTIYNVLIGSFEFLAAGVWVGCAIFLIRRNIIKLKRFSGVEMTSWPKSDANYILITEILLMTAFLLMNAADAKLQAMGVGHYTQVGAFPLSQYLQNLLPATEASLIAIERGCWWFHIIGIFAFLNYLPYSKHFHILFAFPNTYFSNLEPKGEFSNMQSVTNEVKAMLDPSFTPPEAEPGRFGAKDVNDLTWVNLMNAYTCTECGRCTSVCPANITGKLLSPRKIMMDTRDRMEEVGKNIDKTGNGFDDGKSLIDSYISREEIWACTSCNACTQACPINIDPLAIITELRRYAVMEESQSPASINAMLGNIENNGAPWKYSPADRFNWAKQD